MAHLTYHIGNKVNKLKSKHFVEKIFKKLKIDFWKTNEIDKCLAKVIRWEFEKGKLQFYNEKGILI